MSVDFVGPDAFCSKIFTLLARYEEFCTILAANGTLPDHSSLGNERVAPTIDIENKYYRARLNVFFNRSVDEITEALVIVCDASEIPTISSKYSDIGDAVFEGNINLRLLVTVHELEKDFAQSERETVINWTLDRGFEHVEIYLGNYMEDHLSRDKMGLPRLMEALQSTMWSSMEKKGAGSSNIRKEDVEYSINAPEPEISSTPIPTSDIAVENSSSVVGPQDPADDSDDDIKMFDAFASALSEARSIRDKARQGDISDDERRRRAADMAMRLMEMLNLDDEEDD